MAYSGSQITRLGLSATPRGLYGSFAGKALDPIVIEGVPHEYVLPEDPAHEYVLPADPNHEYVLPADPTQEYVL